MKLKQKVVWRFRPIIQIITSSTTWELVNSTQNGHLPAPEFDSHPSECSNSKSYRLSLSTYFNQWSPEIPRDQPSTASYPSSNQSIPSPNLDLSPTIGRSQLLLYNDSKTRIHSSTAIYCRLIAWIASGIHAKKLAAPTSWITGNVGGRTQSRESGPIVSGMAIRLGIGRILYSYRL